jgi:hypothetical protein
MNRAHWQALAEERLLAAHALLAAQHWSSAYYLAGYAVEFGLKSCILAHVERTGTIFTDKKYSEKCWSHDLKLLLVLAGLDEKWKVDSSANPMWGGNWRIIIEWNEMSRYEQITQADAQELFDAITDNVNGVMPWMRGHW